MLSWLSTDFDAQRTELTVPCQCRVDQRGDGCVADLVGHGVHCLASGLLGFAARSAGFGTELCGLALRLRDRGIGAVFLGGSVAGNQCDRGGHGAQRGGQGA
jgi:hypothetical protein